MIESAAASLCSCCGCGASASAGSAFERPAPRTSYTARGHVPVTIAPCPRSTRSSAKTALSPLAGVPRQRHCQRPGGLRARGRGPRGVLGGLRRTSSSGSQPWSQVLDWSPPHAKWFVGGKLNVSANCLDRHVRTWRRNKAAFIWEGEPGDRRTLTYFDLYREVCQFANVLKSLGVPQGRPRRDLPAAHPRAGHRDAGLRAHRRRALAWSSAASAPSRCAIASTTRRRGCSSPPTAAIAAAQIVPLKQMADEALRGHAVDRARGRRPARGYADIPVHMKEGRDHWYHRLMHGRVVRLPAGADGRRGHALHPLHLRHDREAEGHRPHDRRLPASAPTPRPSGSST